MINKLLCLDCLYCTSDYTETTKGINCLKTVDRLSAQCCKHKILFVIQFFPDIYQPLGSYQGEA
jgi:hypothetical protein